jgi:hypothetical protein
MTFRKLETFIIIAIIAAIGIIYAFTQSSTIIKNADKDNGNIALTQEQGTEKQTPSIQYQGINGKTALEILKSTHQVQTQEYKGLGEFVQGIDGTVPAKDEFWSFYVSGKQAQVGASAYITKNGELIEWKLEKVGEYK